MRARDARSSIPWPLHDDIKRPGDVLFWHRIERAFVDVEFTHWGVYVGFRGKRVRDERGKTKIVWFDPDDDIDGDIDDGGKGRGTRARARALASASASASASDDVVECVAHLWGAPSRDDKNAARNRDMSADASCVLTPIADVGDDPRFGNATYDAERAPLRSRDILDRCRLAIERGYYERQFGGYCVRTNNCEHFATWARYGTRESEQIDRRVATVARVAASLWRGVPVEGLELAKAMMKGTLSRVGDDEDVKRSCAEMLGERRRAPKAEDDVAHVLEYLVDRVEVDARWRREETARLASHPPSARRRNEKEIEIASFSFGRERRARDAPSSASRARARARSGDDDVSLDADDLAQAAGALGAFVRSASASAFRVLAAVGDELARSANRPPVPVPAPAPAPVPIDALDALDALALALDDDD